MGVPEAAFAAATFNASAFRALMADPGLAAGALAIPFLAGVSELLGQAYILSLRRVAPVHALVSLTLTGLIHLIAVAVWATACFFFLELDRIADAPLPLLLGAISLGYAPRLLGALTIAPFYGEILGRALDAWAMASVAWAVWSITQAPAPVVILCAGAGWLASFALRHLGGVLFAPLLRFAGVAVAGMRRV